MLELGIPSPKFEIIGENRWGQIEDLTESHYYENNFILKLDKTMIRTGVQTQVSSINQYKKTIESFRKHNINYGTFFAEKLILGKEISAHFLCNGTDWTYLGSARDFKKLYENDQGKNSAGTGSYSPVDYINENIERQLYSYIDKILNYLNEHGVPYHGIIYLGIMIDNQGTANVLEINTRPGNPEFGTIIDTINSGNLLENLYNSATGDQLTKTTHDINSSVSISIVNQNYATTPIKEQIPLEIVADTRFTIVKYDLDYNGNNYFFNISRIDSSVSNSAQEIYQYLETQDLTGFRYRKDIGL
jgi:phosphoribosylamine--glycine ligase